MKDIIKREIIIKASKDRVYAAITDPTQITSWFPSSVEGELSEGEMPVFVFDGHGKNQLYIEKMQPKTYFAYRWVPGSVDFVGDVRTVPNTLVEFSIEETNDGCRLTVTESGFAALPSDIAEAKYEQNNGGWTFMLGRLEKNFKE